MGERITGMKKTLGMVVLLIAAMGVVGCSDSHEKVVKDQLSLLEKTVEVLEGVTDKESAEAAKPELEAILAEDELIDARLQELGQLKRGEKRELEEEYGQATKDAVGDLLDQYKRLVGMRAVRDTLQPWVTMEPLLSELSLTDTAERIAESRSDREVNDIVCRTNQKAIETAASLYRLKAGSSPRALTDLVATSENSNGYGCLPETPKCPEGGTYTVDGACTIDHTD
jgi:hypothetical protein